MVLEPLIHLWCHQDLLGGRLLVISTSCVVLVPWLACELQHISDNAALIIARRIKYAKQIGHFLPHLTAYTTSSHRHAYESELSSGM
jgi:hypothetical protein